MSKRQGRPKTNKKIWLEGNTKKKHISISITRQMKADVMNQIITGPENASDRIFTSISECFRVVLFHKLKTEMGNLIEILNKI